MLRADLWAAVPRIEDFKINRFKERQDTCQPTQARRMQG
ncbi:hypothetical protein VDGD_21328 [Verticillium dahliae]|nr:hypothetical protein VDGD_21328 [Verticillium dahliae]